MSSDIMRGRKTMLQNFSNSVDRIIAKIVENKWWIPVIELAIIALFAAWLGREYLDLDPATVPFGREIMMVIQSHNLWNIAKECGTCAFWNGSTTGGYPAFIEVFGAPLHPIIILTTLLWGVINGTKIALVISLWVAGLAQWWIGRELRVGWLPRMWAALTAVAGGHLAGRIEAGAFTILMSTAVASLVIPGLLAVERRRDRRAAVLLAIVLASAIFGGQGYMQVGILLSLPAVTFLLVDKKLMLRPVWRRYVLAAVLAVMLAAPLLLPLTRFFPNFGKPVDPEFKSAQPLEYLPLNLVINDPEFYFTTQTLEKLAAAAPYTMYIGWVAVILAVIGMGFVRKEDRGRIYYLASGAILVFLVASGLLLNWLFKVLPIAAAVRFPSFIAGFAIPMILGLSAYGLERILNLDWPTLMVRLPGSKPSESLGFSLRWILLVPLFINLKTSTTFAKAWLTTLQLGDDVPWIEETLTTPELQWVSPPFGEHYFITPTITSGLKISPGLKPWGWKERPVPLPRLEALRGGPPSETVSLVEDQFGIFVYLHEDRYYAAVVDDQGQQPCVATGTGGDLRVDCNSDLPGRLVVQENTWTGWKAWRDDMPVPLVGDAWLEVEAPAGRHSYRFEYRPWDVPLGIV
ncbi:MAG: hypothetical protein GTO14_01335, partial [Anaerolineales bacterium]|nr:hypothetical protein [Anaerolineales bacterium]